MRPLGVMHLTTLVIHLQTNSEAKMFNKTMVARLLHYILEHHHRWDRFVHPLIYVYGTQLHRSSNTTSYRFVLFCQLWDLQHTSLVAPYRPTRMANVLHKSCGNTSNNEFEPYAPERNFICLRRDSSIDGFTTVAFP